MNKLKARFKKAIFAFFKEEIIETVDWREVEKTQIISKIYPITSTQRLSKFLK